jgi:hypothetical protein
MRTPSATFEMTTKAEIDNSVNTHCSLRTIFSYCGPGLVDLITSLSETFRGIAKCPLLSLCLGPFAHDDFKRRSTFPGSQKPWSSLLKPSTHQQYSYPQRAMTLLRAFLTDLRSDYKSSTVCILSDNANASCPSPELLERLSNRSFISMDKQLLHEPQQSRSSSAQTSDLPTTTSFMAVTGSAPKENKHVRGGIEMTNPTKQRRHQQHLDTRKSLVKFSNTRRLPGSIKPQNDEGTSDIQLPLKSDSKLHDYGQIQRPLGTTATPRVACSILPPTA